MADLQDIVDDLEAEIQRAISVEDRRWRLLAHSAQPGETDSVRRQSILSRETSPEVTAWLEGLGLQRARELVDGRLREPDERRGRVQSLLRARLAGEDAAAEFAAAARWPVTGAYAVAVCPGGGEDIAERLRRRRGAADFAWIARGGPLRRARPRPGAPRAARGPRRGRRPPVGCRRRVACRRRVGCRRARRGVTARSGAGRWSPASGRRRWAAAAARDHGARGAERGAALEALLDAGVAVAATAKALHVHRATLYRRLERVEEITGLDLERGDDRLIAHLGLRLYRLASKP